MEMQLSEPCHRGHAACCGRTAGLAVLQYIGERTGTEGCAHLRRNRRVGLHHSLHRQKMECLAEEKVAKCILSGNVYEDRAALQPKVPPPP